MVEPGAAALAASRTLTAADRASLHRCLRRGDRLHAAQGRRQADSRLHLAIAASGEQRVGDRGGRRRADAADELLRAIPVIPANIAHSDRQHAAIVDAILAGQPDVARIEMEEHVDGTAALLRGFLS